MDNTGIILYNRSKGSRVNIMRKVLENGRLSLNEKLR